MDRIKSNWVMDFETLSNCFVACFEDYIGETNFTFVIHELRDDREELIKFLQENKTLGEWHVSFNGLGFDSQITEFILKNAGTLRKLTAEQCARKLYEKAQDVIGRSHRKEFQEYPEWKLSIKQIDVYKLNHWDNANKRTSLKWAQFAMDWENLQDMPIYHTTEITTLDEIDTIISYCQNDVKSTKKVMNLSKSGINLRRQIGNKYKINCYNYSNTKIGSELLLNLFCEKTGQDKQYVKKTGTSRPQINVKDILFPYISFKSPELQEFHKKLLSQVIINTKGDFQHTQKFMGYEFFYGTGGIHQCISPGIYTVDDEYIIKDADVASLYPSIAVVNEMYPAHLGKAFFEVYKNDIVDVRLAEKAKKELGDKAIVEGFKEAANATYGNSNSQYSWLFDPQYTMQTTINGQLMLTMVVEEILLTLDNPILLQTNTDGFTFKLKKKDLDKYYEICKKWEQTTKLILEYADYEKMFIWDVNNYISLYTNGKNKCKGRFEWEDLQNYKPSHLHKNKSHLIVPKAIFNYFVNNIPPEKYLQENRNIFDYCAGVKIKGDWEFISTFLTKQVPEKFQFYTNTEKINYLKVNGWLPYYNNWIKQYWIDSGNPYEKMAVPLEEAYNQAVGLEAVVKKETLQKTIRYYISNNGCKIVKRNLNDSREIQVEAGRWVQTVFNQYEKKDWKDYDVNEQYYLDLIYKEISALNVVKKQLTLF